MSASPPLPSHRRLGSAVIGVLVVVVVVLVVLYLTGRLPAISTQSTSTGSSSGGVPPGSLPPASSLSSEPSGWASGSTITPWQLNGHPVLFFEGATWSPYSAASSWVIYKALVSFGGLSGVPLNYSSEDDIPEAVVAGVGVSHGPIAFLVAEDTSGTVGQFPTITNPTEQAYITAYGGSAIPFVVINGQYVHGEASLASPSAVSPFTTQQMESAALTESGSAWMVIASETYLTLAFIVESLGVTPASLATEYHWSPNLTSGVESALSSL